MLAGEGIKEIKRIENTSGKLLQYLDRSLDLLGDLPSSMERGGERPMSAARPGDRLISALRGDLRENKYHSLSSLTRGVR
jgi:hypothetical protein